MISRQLLPNSKFYHLVLLSEVKEVGTLTPIRLGSVVTYGF